MIIRGIGRFFYLSKALLYIIYLLIKLQKPVPDVNSKTFGEEVYFRIIERTNFEKNYKIDKYHKVLQKTSIIKWHTVKYLNYETTQVCEGLWRENGLK